MSSPFALQTFELTLAVREALRAADREAAADRESAVREKLARLASRARELRQQADEHQTQLAARLGELADALATQVPAPGSAPGATEPASRSFGEARRDQWRAAVARIAPAYEALATALRTEAVHVPSLRPANLRRSLFHVASACVALTCVTALPPWAVVIPAGAFSLWAWSMETARRFSPRVNTILMGWFAPIAHPHEAHRINSATWYSTALVILALTRDWLVGASGVVALGVGDPIAAEIGRRFGRVRLVHGRSLEGSLAFFLSSTLCLVGLYAVFQPGLALPQALGIAAAASLAGALAELFSQRLDDNLTVPLVAGAAAAGARALLVG